MRLKGLAVSGDLPAEMDLWPRVRAAIYATTVSRSAIELAWSECHKAKCQHQHRGPDEAFSIMLKQVADSVYAELLCEATSNPDLGQDLA